VGDVAFYFLPYFRLILEVEPSTMFIALERKREEVVASYLQKEGTSDLWSACVDSSKLKSASQRWVKASPKFACINHHSNATRALNQYWDLYHDTLRELQHEFPDRVRVFPFPDTFRDVVVQKEMLVWAGFEDAITDNGIERFNCHVNCRQGIDKHPSPQKRAEWEKKAINIQKDAAKGRDTPLAHLFPGLSTVDYTLPFKAYYLNLNSEPLRREYMESTFGKIWGSQNLIRVLAVDGRNTNEMLHVVDSGEMSKAEFGHHFDVAGTDARVSFGSAISHLKAIHQAYLDGDNASLIMNDNIAPHFMPFWTSGIKDILRDLGTRHWDSVLLHYTTNTTAPNFARAGQLVGENLYSLSHQKEAGAYIISRKGMEKVIKKYFTTTAATWKITHLSQTSTPGLLEFDDNLLALVLTNTYATVREHCK